MSLRNLLLNFIAFTVLAMASTPSLAVSCDIFFTKNYNLRRAARVEVKRAEQAVAKDKLERLVEEELHKAGFKTIDDETTSWRIRLRTKRLADKIDPYQFQNERYRRFWIEKLVNLKISENLSLADDTYLSLNKIQRRSLVRLILRSVINKGLVDIPTAEQDPNLRAKFMKVTRFIRHNWPMRLVAEWRLPRRTVLLTEEQLFALAQNGSAAITQDPILAAALRSEGRTLVVQGLNTAGLMAFYIVYAYYGYTNLAPKFLDAYETASAYIIAQNTEKFIDKVEVTTAAIDAEALQLALATDEIEVVENDVLSRYGSEVTADEKLEIRRDICLDPQRFGKTLSLGGQKECLAF